jgi:hypothetical protein
VRLDLSAKPARLDLVRGKGALFCVYALEKGELRLCWWGEAADRQAELAAAQETAKTGVEAVPEQFLILVTCRDEGQQVELLEKFRSDGLECRALLS